MGIDLMRIALSGYYGFDNAGDEALLNAITSSIRRLAPEAEFVVFSGAPEKTSSEHGVQAVYYKNPIKVWREYRELTQQKVAEEIGISIPFVSQLETGKRNASIDVMKKMALILNVDIDDLV